MTLVSYPVPGCYGGISELPAAMRHPTQCEVQTNGLSTLAQGLIKRPGTEHISTLPNQALYGGNNLTGSQGNVYTNIIDRDTTGIHMVAIKDGSMMLFNLLTGENIPVEFAVGSQGYISNINPLEDLHVISVADYTFITNKRKVVRLDASKSPSNSKSACFINVRTPVVKTKYTIDINDTLYSINSGEVATYVDGVKSVHGFPDTAVLTNAHIAEEIRKCLSNAMPSSEYAVTIIEGTNVVKVVSLAGVELDCKVSDGWSNNCLQSMTQGVTLYSDLPARFEEGYVVTIKGAAGVNASKYYVEWKDNQWTETLCPDVAYKWDASTLPHRLYKDPLQGSWKFEPAEWGERKVGDDKTNPAASFNNRTINSMFFHRNRLGILSEDNVILSRSGDYFNHWASSVTTSLATDPIDLAAPGDTSVNLKWATALNQDLILWSSSKQQFVLVGGDLLTAETARIQPTTAFDITYWVKPELVGNKILFLSEAGGSSQVFVYKVSTDTLTNEADNITTHCPNYVTGNPLMIKATTAFKAAVVIPKGVSNTIEFLKWDEDTTNDALSQKAWQRFSFDYSGSVRFLNAHWVGSKLYLIIHSNNEYSQTTDGNISIEVIDFTRNKVDYPAGISLKLDKRVKKTLQGTSGATYVDVPYIEDVLKLKAFKVSDGLEPVAITITSSQVLPNGTTRLFLSTNQLGVSIVVGISYEFNYEFTECFMRDKDGNPLQAATLKIAKLILRHEATGFFEALVTPFLRETYTYVMEGRRIGQPNQGATKIGLSDGHFSIPIQTRAGELKVVIKSTSHLPLTIPYAEWVVDITMKAQR